MAPKAKPKAKGKAESTPAKAKAGAKADAKAKASPAPGSTVAGSGAAAVKQARVDNAVLEKEAEPPGTLERSTEETTPLAEIVTVVETSLPSKEVVEIAKETEAPSKEESCREDDTDADGKARSSEVCDKEESKTVDLSDIPDPWADVLDNEALKKIKKEDWEVIQLGDASPTAPCHLSGRNAELTKFHPSEAHYKQLVSADLSENLLANVAAIGGPMWLRALLLANNPIESLVGLPTLFPRLLSLDISFVDLSGVDDCWEVLAACPCLQQLHIEGCSVASLEDFKPMPKLVVLNLQDNALESLYELDILVKRCPNLLELDLQENDIVTEGGYRKKVKSVFPNLAVLDGQSQKAYVIEGQNEAYKNASGMDKEIMAVDGMYKNEGCSCLDGNPCLTPETCKDWKNREAIASEARKRKGLRDDFGKQL